MPIPARGDIYHIEIAKGEAMGHELEGCHWWVVISSTELNNQLNLFTAVPLTSVINEKTGKAKDDGDFRYFRIRILNSAKKKEAGRTDRIFNADSIALTEQLRTFSTVRIKDQPKSGVVDPPVLGAIEAGLLFVLRASFNRRPTQPPPTPQAVMRHVLPTESPKPIPGNPHKK